MCTHPSVPRELPIIAKYLGAPFLDTKLWAGSLDAILSNYVSIVIIRQHSVFADDRRESNCINNSAGVYTSLYLLGNPRQ